MRPTHNPDLSGTLPGEAACLTRAEPPVDHAPVPGVAAVQGSPTAGIQGAQLVSLAWHIRDAAHDTTRRSRARFVAGAVAWIVVGLVLMTTGVAGLVLAAREAHASPEAANLVGLLAAGTVLFGLLFVILAAVDMAHQLRRWDR